jgi:TusA-related sulfurtransferase
MKLKLKKVGEKYELDVKDMVCPFPLTLTKLALEKVDNLEVITNNPPSARDIPRVLRKYGYEVDVKREGEVWRIGVRR